jgi:hypothetical protein
MKNDTKAKKMRKYHREYRKANADWIREKRLAYRKKYPAGAYYLDRKTTKAFNEAAKAQGKSKNQIVTFAIRRYLQESLKEMEDTLKK